jgi:hypothetical protein
MLGGEKPEENELSAYLPSNRNTMQKPIEGLPVLARFTTKSMLKNGRREEAKKTIAELLRGYPAPI